jgi:hypothetical protein
MITMSPDEDYKLTPEEEEIFKMYYQAGSIYIKNTPMSLDELALKHGTDKSSRGHSYAKYYDMLFEKLMYAPVNLLEIGIDKGDSLKMWREYFHLGVIHGIDIRGDYEYLHDHRTKTHVVDHSSKADLIAFGEQHGQHFNIIIEDGSHQSADSILTFETLFPYLKSGGFYAIEDVLCDYDPRWNKGGSSIEYFKNLIDDVNMNGNIPSDSICANKTDVVKKYAVTYFQEHIEWMFSSCGLFIIKKI